MLRFAEEIVLLLLHDDDGRFITVPNWSIRYAIAGAVLMDLAMEDRIDSDLEKLIVIDSSPVGDDLLDPTLEAIAAVPQHDIRFWVDQVAAQADSIREEALARLVSQGVLEVEDDRILWVFRSRRYPVVDGTAEREVKLRIMEVLFSDAIPAPRDVVIICLADGCGIFNELLSRRELDAVAPRIDQVRKLDLIGQTMTQAIRDIEISIAASMQHMQ